MRAREFIAEGSGQPVIVVDVQPEYSGMNDGDENPVFPEIIEFVALKQTGPVLMFVNAENQGLTGDTVASIKQYWEDTVRERRGELDEIQRIELLPDTFPIEHVKSLLDKAKPTEHLIDGLRLYEMKDGEVIGLILADERKMPTAFAGFISRKGDKIWEVANAKTYDPYIGKALVAKIYKLVKETYGKSIQSDIEQTTGAERLWTRTLPAMGLNPMIYDTDTGYIIDPKNTNIDVYDRSQPYRYAWIIERNDRYRESDLLREDRLQILMPFRGLWHDCGISIDERRMFNEAVSNPINWNRFTIVDKGYGYFREFMDDGVEPRLIVKLIRYMYQKRVNDARDLVMPPEDERTPDEIELAQLLDDYHGVSFTINWTSVAHLKRFNGAYIVGGGRNECLREVELLMNAFNIRYKRIDSLVYG